MGLGTRLLLGPPVFQRSPTFSRPHGFRVLDIPHVNALSVPKIRYIYNHVSPIEKLSVNSIISSPVSQKLLSSKVNVNCFQNLFDRSSPANKARLLSVSAPHATSWLSVIPSTSQGLHLDPIEFRVAVKWWLGLDTSQGSQCAFCPAHSLDSLGHHALACKCGVMLYYAIMHSGHFSALPSPCACFCPS